MFFRGKCMGNPIFRKMESSACETKFSKAMYSDLQVIFIIFNNIG